MNVNDVIRMLAELPDYIRKCEVEVTDNSEPLPLDGAYQVTRFVGSGDEKYVETAIVLTGDLSNYINRPYEVRKVLDVPRQ